MDARDMGQDLEKVLFTEEQINDKLVELAAQIDEHYAGRNILVVGVLRGAVMVVADLVRKIHSPVAMDWMAVSSYGSGTKSSGVVRILKDLDTDITDREVLIVEDIIDSGLTLSWLKSNLKIARSKGCQDRDDASQARSCQGGDFRGLCGLRYPQRVCGGLRARLRRRLSPSVRHWNSRTTRLRRIDDRAASSGCTI